MNFIKLQDQSNINERKQNFNVIDDFIRKSLGEELIYGGLSKISSSFKRIVLELKRISES